MTAKPGEAARAGAAEERITALVLASFAAAPDPRLRRLLEKLGATVTEGAAIVDLPELGGSARLKESGLPLFTLVDFAGH